MSAKRIVVVDDSYRYQRLLVDVIEEHPSLEVAGVAANGKLALDMIGDTRPHLITLDILMPEYDGIQALMAVKRRWPSIRTIMFSSLTSDGSDAALDALALGASDCVLKPQISGGTSETRQALRELLLPKIEALLGLEAASFTPSTGQRPIVAKRPVLPKPIRLNSSSPTPEIVVIGVSTGGPDALTKLLMHLPGNFGVPVCIVQHMPPEFTAKLASRLDSGSDVTVVEAQGGETLQPGTVYIAPGDYHMVLERQATGAVLKLNQEEPENSCRPSVDPLFRSAASIYGDRVLGVVMTGMGQDGLHGSEELKSVGASVIVQDEASCVVWGMPKLVALAGLADEEVPLDRLADNITNRVQPSVLSRARQTTFTGGRVANSDSYEKNKVTGS